MENNDKRMRDLVSKLDQKTLIVKEGEEKDVNDKVLKEQSDRFKKLSLYTEVNSFAYNSGVAPIVGQGAAGDTVNTIVDTGDSTYTIGPQARSVKEKPAVNVGVTAKEALELCIKRSVDSGAPINNIGFYDEVNWNLQNMGYPAKLPLEIKEALNDLLKYGEVKDK